MRGCLLKAKTKRGLQKRESAWRIIIPFGRYENGKPRQKWITFYGTRQQADAKLADLVGDVNRGEFVEASKLTVGQWLNEWLDKAIQPPRRSNNTYVCWKGIIKNHLTPALGHLPLQQLTYLHLEQYYAEAGLKFAPATVAARAFLATWEREYAEARLAAFRADVAATAAADVLKHAQVADVLPQLRADAKHLHDRLVDAITANVAFAAREDYARMLGRGNGDTLSWPMLSTTRLEEWRVSMRSYGLLDDDDR